MITLPISRAVKLGILCLLLVGFTVVGYFLWNHAATLPAPEQKWDRAERLRQQGKWGEAARIYREVAEAQTEESARAIQAVTEMLELSERGDKVSPVELAEVLRVAMALREQPGIAKDLFPRGLKLAEACLEENPAGSLLIVEAVEPAAPKSEAVLPLKQKILERLTRAQADNVDGASQLAFLYERTGQRDRCQTLLEPLAKKLGSTEGARILGTCYNEQGKYEEAYALLQPYVDHHLPLLREAERQLLAASTAAAGPIQESVKNRTAKDFDYSTYDAAPQSKKQEMIGEFITGRLRENKQLQRLQEALERELVVDFVALDLGQLQRKRARGLADPVARRAELERAAKTFLAIRGPVAEQEKGRLGLAEVYYRLDKPEQGRKLVDEALEAEGRKAEALQRVAQQVNEWGVRPLARKLLEEAHARADVEPAQRQAIALLRSQLASTVEDQLTWLERSNLADPDVKAALANARGVKAQAEGRDKDAVKAFREAVAVYAALPASAGTLQKGGLALWVVYQATGEREPMEQAIQMLEKARALQPNDVLLIGDVAAVLLSAGLADVIGNRIDQGKLKRAAAPSDLPFLYLTSPERLALVGQLRTNAHVKDARSLLDQASILAPNNIPLCRTYEQLLSLLEDREGLATLEKRNKGTMSELTEEQQHLQDSWQGRNDEQARESATAALTRAEQLVKATRPGGGATFALAAAALVEARLLQEPLAGPIDHDALVKLAEEAHKAAPSNGTLDLLKSAFLARASASVAAREPEYAAMATRARRSLNSRYLLAAALWSEGKTRAAALGNPDVVQVLRLLLEDVKRMPAEADEWTWVMLRPAHPEEAARVAQAIPTNELRTLERQLEGKRSPLTAAMVLRQCWALEAAGKQMQGPEIAAVLKQAAVSGVPLPFGAR